MGKKKWFAQLLKNIESEKPKKISYFTEHVKETLNSLGLDEEQIKTVNNYHRPLKYYSLNKKTDGVTKTYNLLYLQHMVDCYNKTEKEDFNEAYIESQANLLDVEYRKMLDYEGKYFMM